MQERALLVHDLPTNDSAKERDTAGETSLEGRPEVLPSQRHGCSTVNATPEEEPGGTST